MARIIALLWTPWENIRAWCFMFVWSWYNFQNLFWVLLRSKRTSGTTTGGQPNPPARQSTLKIRITCVMCMTYSQILSFWFCYVTRAGYSCVSTNAGGEGKSEYNEERKSNRILRSQGTSMSIATIQTLSLLILFQRNSFFKCGGISEQLPESYWVSVYRDSDLYQTMVRS